MQKKPEGAICISRKKLCLQISKKQYTQQGYHWGSFSIIHITKMKKVPFLKWTSKSNSFQKCK